MSTDYGPLFAPAPPSRRRWKVAVAVLAVLVLTAVTGGAVFMRSRRHNTTAHKVAQYAVASPVARTDAACLDKSGSVDTDHDLANHAVAALQSGVQHLSRFHEAVPSWKAAAPVAGLNLIVRVVRKNSFATGQGDRYTVTTTPIKSSPGTSAGMPDDSVGTAGLAAWSSAQDAATKARRDQGKAQADASADLQRLNSLTSDGSDISGCIAALLQITATDRGPRSFLVVTDCEDTVTRNLKGSATGSFAGAQLTIVQACPSGDPNRCAATLRAFEKRLAPLGLDPKHTNLYRAEDVSAAVDTWLEG